MSQSLTPEQIERGLTDCLAIIRWAFAQRTDFVPTPAQIERGLTDVHWDVRRAFAKRTDFVPTPAQVERGLKDIAGEVRLVFLNRHAEWQAKWEAQELRKRHASVVTTKLKMEAL